MERNSFPKKAQRSTISLWPQSFGTVGSSEDGLPTKKDYDNLVFAPLRENTKRERRGKLRRDVMLLQENAPTHGAPWWRQELNKWFTLPQPRYKTSSHFILFTNLKKKCQGEDLVMQMTWKLSSRPISIVNLAIFWPILTCCISDVRNFIDVHWDYIEKKIWNRLWLTSLGLFS